MVKSYIKNHLPTIILDYIQTAQIFTLNLIFLVMTMSQVHLLKQKYISGKRIVIILRLKFIQYLDLLNV